VPAPVREAQRLEVGAQALEGVALVAHRLAESADALKLALVRREAARAWAEYQTFEFEEYPPFITPEEEAALVEEARKKSLADLLSSGSSSRILQGWGSLRAAFGRSPTPTSSAGEPA
jgi:hypothetical protein